MISIIFVSLIVVSAVSAADNSTDVIAADDNEELKAVEIDSKVEEMQTDEVLSEVNDDSIKFNITVNDTPYDEDANIEFNVIDANASLDYNNTVVNLMVDGSIIGNTTLDSTGKAVYIIPAGTYDVGGYYLMASTGSFDKSVSSKLFNIVKATPVVNVNDVEAVTKTIIKIPFNVTDSKGNGIDGDAIVTIHWSNDVISKRVKVKDGKADVQFDISDLIGIFGGSGSGFNFSTSFGNGTNRSSFNISALFGENGTFNITALLGTNGTNSTLNITALFGENGTFNISTLTKGNSTFNFGNFTGGNGTFNFTNLFNFNKSLKFAYVLDVGRYNMTVTYLPSRNYCEYSNDTAKLIITYAEDVVYFCEVNTPYKYGDDTNVTFRLVDKYGNPISNETVNVALNGEDKGNVTLDENGTASFVIPLLTNGDYEFVISYNGTNTTVNFTVAVPMKTTITAKSISVSTVNTKVDGKIGKYLSFKLTDESGKVLADQKVKLAINGKVHTLTTGSDGIAKLQLNIAKAGVYTASMCFLGNGYYLASFKAVKVTVKKQTAKLKTKSVKYKAKTKTKKLTATFKSSKGNAIAGKKITFKVKGKTYTAKTNKKGVAAVKVKLSKKGSYTFAASFAGDNTYNKVIKKAKLILK